MITIDVFITTIFGTEGKPVTYSGPTEEAVMAHVEQALTPAQQVELSCYGEVTAKDTRFLLTYA